MRFLMFIFIVLLTQSCSSHKNNPNLPSKTCTLYFSNTITLQNVLLAETPAQQTKGLSGKNPVAESMLFQYKTPQIMHFWMHDTNIPLTIGFIDAKGVLFQITDMEPNTDTVHTSRSPALYALELRQKQYKALNLTLGTVLISSVCHELHSNQEW